MSRKEEDKPIDSVLITNFRVDLSNKPFNVIDPNESANELRFEINNCKKRCTSQNNY